MSRFETVLVWGLGVTTALRIVVGAYDLGHKAGMREERNHEIEASVACHQMTLDRLGVRCALLDDLARDGQ